MANFTDPRIMATGMPATADVRGVAFDAGLRAHMLGVYNRMASGVLLTGIVALLLSQWDGYAALMQTPLRWLIVLAPLGFVMAMSFGINRMSTATLSTMFWVFSAVMGASMASLFYVYTGASIAVTFFATAAAFLGLSLFGYTTKKDLSGLGTFLIMGVVGLLVAMIANIFIQSSGLAMIISAIGVLLFAGLTAYDTQKIKAMYAHVAGTDFAGKAMIMGALTLYLDFINMFQFLLSFLGNRE